jgi:DNA-binding CsgD family transcriptional regulator
MMWCPGRIAECNAIGTEALALLETMPAGHSLALAYSDAAARATDDENAEGVLEWAPRAIELGERLDIPYAVVRALISMGTTDLLRDRLGGIDLLERGTALSEEHGLEGGVATAYLNGAWAATRTRQHGLAERYVPTGIAYCTERGLDLQRRYLFAYRARIELDRGRWTEATEAAERVLREPTESVLLLTLPVVVLALVRARRGDPEVWPLLDEAWALIEPSGQLQGVGAVSAARAEAAWLDGDHVAVGEATEFALSLAVARRSAWMAGELLCWRRRAGIEDALEADAAAGPWAAELRGDPLAASKEWAALGCPYEAAMALSQADDEHALRRALDGLQELGAAAPAAIVSRRLRERGVRAVPRGPRAATQRNPGGLSTRELEVLELLVEGLRNAEIARRLFISEKTAGHHVSAILRKLGVSNRGEASAAAIGLGLAPRA